MKIAVFDSGFGSISIIREIQKIFKGELIYFADQKNFPYGVKSKIAMENIIKEFLLLGENPQEMEYGRSRLRDEVPDANLWGRWICEFLQN